MRKAARAPGDPLSHPRIPEQAHARTYLLLTGGLLAGLAGGVFLGQRLAAPPVAAPPGPEETLSQPTRALLQSLDSPVAIRFYSLLDPASVPASESAFAGRVSQLLSGYEQEARGKITVTRYTNVTDAAMTAASADGLKPFHLEKGQACYLGMAVEQNRQKAALAQLSPDWEPAVEYDLSRAIARVISATPAAPPALLATQTDASVLEEVKRAVPTPASVSLEDGTRLLREQAQAEFGAATQAMTEKVKAAEQRLAQAQQAGSGAARQAALQELQQVRAERTEKLQQIAARLDERIAAWEQLKKK